jgi:tetratricopeptide (TPR) repeat protein
MDERFSNSTVMLNTLYRLAEIDPSAALERMLESDADFADNIHYRAFRPGILINAGSALNDPDLLQEGVESLAVLLESGDSRLTAWHGALYYNLGNGYSELAARKRHSGVDPDDPILQQTKYAYRKAIAATENVHDQHFLAELYTNYGNALSSCGRHFEALLAYDQALKAEPSHSMALGNKGIELARYAFLARNQSGLLLAEAYEWCRAGAEDESLDSRGLATARTVFAKHRDSLKPIYAQWHDRLKAARHRTPIGLPHTREEEHHHHFAVEHGLYLNLCVHSWPCSEQYNDGLFFGYMAPAQDPYFFNRLARYFNQAKEDYATARYLLAESLRPTPRRQRISVRTRYADLLEYADYGLTAGLVKTAYASTYNILDKIAVFLKWELELPESETDISFRRVWHSNRKSKELRPEIRQKDDPSLFALYDMALEFGQPAFKNLGELRRAITHRHLVTHDWLRMVGEHSTEQEHILLDDLIDSGVAILKLVKAALIYLAAYLNQEHERRMSVAQGIVAPLEFWWQDEMR